MRPFLAVLSLLAVSLGAACDAPASSAAPSWVCGREYENHAWGYSRRGVVIDGGGRVFSYEFRSSPAALVNPWRAKDPEHMTEQELAVRYNGAADTGRRVPPREIAAHQPLMRDAAGVPLTEPRNVGADMGTTIVYCLVRNDDGTYRQVVLDQKGDFERANPSPAARTLLAWLAPVLR